MVFLVVVRFLGSKKEKRSTTSLRATEGPSFFDRLMTGGITIVGAILPLKELVYVNLFASSPVAVIAMNTSSNVVCEKLYSSTKSLVSAL